MKLNLDYIRLCSLVAVAVVSGTLTGCSDEIGLNGNDSKIYPSDCLAFTTSLAPESASSATRSAVSNLEIAEEQWIWHTAGDDGSASRGSIVNQLSGSAGVLGFQYDNDDGGDKTAIAVDNNVEFEFDGDRLVAKNTTILWKEIEKKHLNVYAYAPYLQTGTTSDGMTLDFETAPPWIDYTVPDVDNQKDILVARWISMDHENPDDPTDYKEKTIPLTFNHILTAIRFRVGFDCKVKSVAIKGVYNSGRYDMQQGEWQNVEQSSGSTESEVPKGPAEYTIDFEQETNKYVIFNKNQLLTGNNINDNYLILMPQTLPSGAKIVLTCVNENGEDEVYTTDIRGMVWKPGKLITYTFYKGTPPGTIYFDLALGDVIINANKKGEGTYSGKVFKDGKEVVVSGEYKKDEKKYHFYVYQSTSDNRANIWEGEVCTPPKYKPIEIDGRPWSDFITNNSNVESVIESWDKNHNELVDAAGRINTQEERNHRIQITGNVTCDITIDNIYSVYQQGKTPDYRKYAGIMFVPGDEVSNAKVTIKSVGDNRVGAVHYHNLTDNGNEIIFEGTGSLTVADVDGIKFWNSDSGLENGEKGYWSNHWSSAIGNHDSPPGDDASYGIVINSGIIFAGTTKAENCTAIGGGGNAYGGVTINGGTVTAVATTTGTAIGGGIGFNSPGGEGNVVITGGNVYAYNHANRWKIPSSAIGGAGSKDNYGRDGTVKISGGYVYAYSELGTAIGGGSSYTLQGGDGEVTITGGEIFAKTGSKVSSSIGGGTACSGVAKALDGGNAIITISGNPIIRTGSIGGGGKGIGNGYIGNAEIKISGGDIQAQFLLSAGTASGVVPSFEMTGGTIRNSNTADSEYLHVKEDGGAVYMENGTIKISAGEIRNCKAKRGGAIYIIGMPSTSGGTSNASLTMTAGKIIDNEANAVNADGTGGGGAIYMIDGTVNLEGGEISNNLAAGGNGGGIFIRRGSLNVSGSTLIHGNACEVRPLPDNTLVGGNGGGIYAYSIQSDINAGLKSGKITGNTADRRGGGLCVIQDNKDNKALITIGTEGADKSGLQITGNHTLLQGGGVYARGINAEIIINSGTIKENTVSQYVYNQDVANDEGSVTLNGEDEDVDVTHIVVTFNANDGSTNPKTSTQKIVTKTNSALKAPEFKLGDYHLVGWNTKPSGAGVSYADGDIMNTDRDITLYAQWKKSGQ